MSKLLYADFNRLRSKAFLVSMTAMILYGIAICIALKHSMNINNTEIELQMGYICGYGINGFIAVPGIIMAVICSVLIGTEFSDGTIRNKLIVGHSRTLVYFSDFILCAFAGILIHAAYVAVIFVIGIPLFGFFTAPAMLMIKITGIGILMTISYAAIFNMISMMVQNKTTVTIINLLGVILIMFLCNSLIFRIQQPKFIEALEIANGKQVFKKVLNTRYLSETARMVGQFIVDIFRTGQSLQLSGMNVAHFSLLAVYSAVVAIIANIAGIVIFQRRDSRMKNLAIEINEQLKLLRKERQRYLHGDLELKEAVTNISHDLRTPLTAVCGYLDLLKEETKTDKANRYFTVETGRNSTGLGLNIAKNLVEKMNGTIGAEYVDGNLFVHVQFNQSRISEMK